MTLSQIQNALEQKTNKTKNEKTDLIRQRYALRHFDTEILINNNE